MDNDTSTEPTGEATFCPEDNKLRLYVGRVPNDEYKALRAAGWTATPKQGCDFVATWTPSRRDTALEYAGIIGDEDQSPADRAADRAERFAGYLEKRTAEALGHADTFDRAPGAFGFQSQARADRAAARHDRHAGRACDAWSKAEYWQQRTAGVISHALHVSTPAVRMGRVKEIEADIRRIEKSHAEYAATFAAWTACAAIEDADKLDARAWFLAGYDHGRDYTHPQTGKVGTLYDLSREDAADRLNGAEVCALWLAAHRAPGDVEAGDWMQHLRLRVAYELQMMEAQGGRAAFVEMEVGGWVGSHQIRKVNKSNATGRVVSVTLRLPGSRWDSSKPGFHLEAFNVERMPAGVYRAPSDEDRAALAEVKKAEKAAAPVKAPCPLVNPTDEEAERLQALLNEHAKADYCARQVRAYGRSYADDWKPSTVIRITQAQYSAASKGSYARAETRGVCRNGIMAPAFSNLYSSEAHARAKERGPAVCEVRTTSGDGSDYGARRVIILSDKPQKPFPAAVWPGPVEAAAPTPEPVEVAPVPVLTVATVAAAVVVGAQLSLF